MRNSEVTAGLLLRKGRKAILVLADIRADNNKMEIELYLANDKNYHAKLSLSPTDIIELKGRVVIK